MASATMGLRRRVPMGNPPASLTPAHHSTGKRSRSENNNSPSHGNLNSLQSSEPNIKKSRTASSACVSSTVSKDSVSQGSRRGSANLRSKNKNCQLSTVRCNSGNSSTISRDDELTNNYNVLNNSAWSVSNSLSESVSYSTMSGLTVSGGQNNLCNATLGMTPAIPYMTTTMATFVGNATNLNKNSPVSYLDISNMTSGSLTSTNGINSYASSTSSEAAKSAAVSVAFSAVAPPSSGNLVYSGIKQLQTSTNKSEALKKPFHNDSMFNAYQPWVIKTYGDLAKTKTITIKKYARILRTLRGEEVNSAENSKFRFWVKSKGFHIGQPEGYDAKPADRIIGRHAVTSPGLDPPLYVPTQLPHSKSPSAAEVAPGRVYKKVAIVENFFDIIHAVHVDLEGRPGKHAGQKRTYRTITETYAFLPREAVTRFLLGCTECQRRPRTPSPTNLSNQSAAAPAATSVPSVLPVAQSPTPAAPLVASPVRPNCETSNTPEFKVAQYPVAKQPKLPKPESKAKEEKKKEKEEKYNPLSISNILKKEPTTLEPECRKTPESDRASSRSSASSKWRRMIPEGRTPSPPPSQPLPRPWSPSLDPKETPIDYSLPITTMYLKHHQRILAEKNKAAAAVALQNEQKTSECTDRVENSFDRDSFSPAAGLIDTNLNLLATIQHLHCQVMLALTERLRPSILPEPLMLPPATAFLPPGLISAGMSIPSALAHNQFS